LDCSELGPLCTDVECGDGEKKILDVTTCCPVCTAVPTCNSTCPVLDCPTGTSPTHQDLHCCPFCRATDFCSTVRCPDIPCPKEEWIIRTGTCCPSCPLCEEDENKVCNEQDTPECRPGFFRPDPESGACNITVPADDRKVKTIQVKYCWKDSGRECNDPPSSDDIKAVIFKFTQGKIDGKYFSIGDLSVDGCCVTFTVTFSVDKQDGDAPDPDHTSETFEDSIAKSDSLTVVKKSSKSSSSSLLLISIWLSISLIVLSLL